MVIIEPDSKDVITKALPGAPTKAVVNSEDPPPSYNAVVPTAGPSTEVPNIPNLKPSNYIALSRQNGSVKGAWLIDPFMSIPQQFLPQLLSSEETEGDRKNIHLQSKNGCVDADIFVLPVKRSDLSPEKKIREFVSIHTRSTNGTVITRVHDIVSSSDVRLPIKVSSYGTNGSLHIYLPRSFRGPAQIKTHNGGVRFSEAMQPHITTFSDMDHVQRSFLGDFNPSEWNIADQWRGDELLVEAKNGNVKIFYDDEATSGWGKPRVPGFFERLFSF